MRDVPERQDRPWPSVSVSLLCGRLAAGRITGRLTHDAWPQSLCRPPFLCQGDEERRHQPTQSRVRPDQ